MQSDFTLMILQGCCYRWWAFRNALSFFALKMAKMIDRKLNITIFDPKAFTKDGPSVATGAGELSQSIWSRLLRLKVQYPGSRTTWNRFICTAYPKGRCLYQKSADEKRIATVYRGGGPKGIKEKEKESFDNFLLQCAIQEGATHSLSG